MNIIDRSLKLVNDLFPKQILLPKRNKIVNYHFSFGYRKNRLICIGLNDELNESPKIKRLAARFGVVHFQKFPYPHSEMDLLSKLWGDYYVDGNLRIVNVRVNRLGNLRYSKPCKNCTEVLLSLGIRELWYSNGNGQFSKWN